MDLEDAKTIGIIGGLFTSAIALFLNFYSTLRSIRSQKISNYQEIIKSHRDIWKFTMENPASFDRIFNTDVDIVHTPITYTEKLFLRLLFLHMSSAWTFAKHSNIVRIEQLELDFSEILLSPIPRKIWSENRKYYNKEFISFFETAGEKKDLFAKLKVMLGTKQPIYFRPWRVLVLSAYYERLKKIVEELGDEAICMTDQDPEVTKDYIKREKIDFIVCFGYGRILKRSVLKTTT